MVNRRNNSPIGQLPTASGPPAEWRESGILPYPAALAAMDRRTAAIAAGQAGELVWSLEHPPLYTAGTSASRNDVRRPSFPVFESGRGGQVTYHGPGQRVVYLMLDLRRRAADVRRYVTTLEEWIIRTLAVFDIAGERRDGRVGVWVRRPDKGEGCEDKIAAIGIRIRRWVSLHGVSLNVDPDLSHFADIVPCGIADPRYGVTSMAALGVRTTMAEVDLVMRREFEPLFGPIAYRAMDPPELAACQVESRSAG